MSENELENIFISNDETENVDGSSGYGVDVAPGSDRTVRMADDEGMPNADEMKTMGDRGSVDFDGMDSGCEMVVSSLPKTRKYRPGEAISYDGLVVEFDGEDVTDSVSLSVNEGTSWGKSTRSLDVIVTYRVDGKPHVATFTLKRKKRIAPAIAAIVALVGIVCAVGVTWYLAQPQHDGGSYLIPKGDMSDEEAQTLVNEMAEKSRIEINLAPNMVLQDDGALRVNFIVSEPNNGLSERLEIEQDGRVVYRSGIVEPGFKLEWGSSNGAHVGSAVATVYAVTGDDDTGNPVSVEVEIVEPGFKADGGYGSSDAGDAAESGEAPEEGSDAAESADGGAE